MTINEMIAHAKKIQNYEFEDAYLVSHFDQIEDLFDRMEATKKECDPDSDEWEILDFWTEDVLQPMMNYLESIAEEYMPESTINLYRQNRKSFESSWLGRKILNE